MRILLSNDDGINADGLHALHDTLSQIAEVWVVAPDREQSASSHAITLHRPLRIKQRKARPRWFEIDGTPSDCVYVAVNHLMKGNRPDLVCAGINDGPNLGSDVLYSGTVAAAMEGALLGIPSVAFSHCGKVRDFEKAANFAPPLIKSLMAEGLERRALINVNFPDGPSNVYAMTHLGQRNYGAVVEEKIDPRGRHYYWIGGGDSQFQDFPGSDCNAVFKEKIMSITPLILDYTNHLELTEMREWKVPGYSRRE